MAITTLDGWIAAAKQCGVFKKTVSATATGLGFTTVFDRDGSPGAGALDIGNTANGVVPTDATAGYPTINAFGGGATGYLSILNFSNSVVSRLLLYDRVFACGAYAFNAATVLAAQPSFLGRIPGGAAADCAGCTEIWVEEVTTATGSLAVTVTYTNEAGAAGHTTGAVGLGGAPAIRRCWQLPLAAGDKGVSVIESVTGSVATAGTFNVMVLRRLGMGRVNDTNDISLQDFMRVGLPVIYDTSALYLLCNPDSTATGLPDIYYEIVNG